MYGERQRDRGRPRCAGTIKRQWWHRSDAKLQCTFSGIIKRGSKWFCKRHA
jgi:hypothetical protein